MNIIFNLFAKRWKELLILLLVGVIFLMRGCGTDYGDKEIINVDGEDFELIHKARLRHALRFSKLQNVKEMNDDHESK